jgi:hypothetical protein
VEWPETAFRSPSDTFVLAIVGEGPTPDAIERLLAAKQLGERPLAIRRIPWDQSFVGIHALFITEDNPRKLHHIFLAAAESAVLTIGEAEGFASEGGVIGLLMENRKVRFDISTGSAEASRLRVSSKLLALTRVVHSATSGSGSRP